MNNVLLLVWLFFYIDEIYTTLNIEASWILLTEHPYSMIKCDFLSITFLTTSYNFLLSSLQLWILDSKWYSIYIFSFSTISILRLNEFFLSTNNWLVDCIPWLLWRIPHNQHWWVHSWLRIVNQWCQIYYMICQIPMIHKTTECHSYHSNTQ